MDTSQTYIKMCYHPAIQKHAPNHYWRNDSREFCATNIIDKKVTWLPRLDQWIGKIQADFTFQFLSGEFLPVILIACADLNTESYETYECHTPEQAACLAYMAQQGYRWAGDGWEEATK